MMMNLSLNDTFPVEQHGFTIFSWLTRFTIKGAANCLIGNQTEIQQNNQISFESVQKTNQQQTIKMLAAKYLILVVAVLAMAFSLVQASTVQDVQTILNDANTAISNLGSTATGTTTQAISLSTSTLTGLSTGLNSLTTSAGSSVGR